MWFVILLIIAVVTFLVIKKKTDDRRADEERERKASEARARVANLEKFTDDERGILAKQGKETLDATINAFEMSKKGDIDAMTMMGYTYKLKLNNATKSFHWMQKAAKAGGPDAMFWLGKYYLHGYGVNENRVTGTHYVLEAAKKGSKDAINCLIEDYGMSKDEMRSNGIHVH